MSGIYCGKNRTPPRGKRIGNSNECFKSGIRAGFIAGLSKSSIKLTNEELKKLKKDTVRSIAAFFKVVNYSNMTKEQLITNILNKKGQRKTVKLEDFK